MSLHHHSFLIGIAQIKFHIAANFTAFKQYYLRISFTSGTTDDSTAFTKRSSYTKDAEWDTQCQDLNQIAADKKFFVKFES